ncbi:MAG: hypothetical protein V7K26_00070 [Nostoc sp.]|uniref:hypothetical protein n=1 Tax=Nostoc sp. TaxID=1180 RepID=UPI002FF03716
MAEVCKDIDQGLAALNKRIDEQNKRIKNLEQKINQCCNSNTSNNNGNNSNQEIELLKEGIVQCLNNFADIENTNQEFALAFKGLYEMVTPLIDSVSTVIAFLGDSD